LKVVGVFVFFVRRSAGEDVGAHFDACKQAADYDVAKAERGIILSTKLIKLNARATIRL
jgi:ATP-dependent protease Clp ATPase subunit